MSSSRWKPFLAGVLVFSMAVSLMFLVMSLSTPGCGASPYFSVRLLSKNDLASEKFQFALSENQILSISDGDLNTYSFLEEGIEMALRPENQDKRVNIDIPRNEMDSFWYEKHLEERYARYLEYENNYYEFFFATPDC